LGPCTIEKREKNRKWKKWPRGASRRPGPGFSITMLPGVNGKGRGGAAAFNKKPLERKKVNVATNPRRGGGKERGKKKANS